MDQANDTFISIDFMGALRRRKWWGLAVLVVLIPLAVAVAVLLPPQYQSSATILIEEPDVPNDLVKSTVSTFAAERLQVIQQRVMTNEHLNAIIDRFGLYRTALETKPRSEVVNGMRNNITLEIVAANLTDQPQSRSRQQQNQASIAFTLAFTHPNPQTAQQVANRLMDLYLAENAQTRQEKAAGTTQFLSVEAQKLYAEAEALNNKISALKSKYAGALPEQLPVNMQLLNQTQSSLMQISANIQALNDKKAFLQSQLTQLSPYQTVGADGRAATPQAQLMQLELQYVDLSAKYGPKHPDVTRLQKQIAALKAQLGTSGTTTPVQAQLSQMQSQLEAALQRYGEKHPEVQKLRARIAELSAEAAKGAQETMLTAPKGPPDNPVYIQFQAQLADVQSQLGGLQAQSASMQTRLDELQAKVLQTPAIESEYNSLIEQYNAAVTRYQSFKDKEADAKVAESMEQQNKGETFSVIEPPDLPVTPIKPNRKLLLAAGVVVSFMLAAGLMLMIEMLDSRIYTGNALETAFGETPLVTLPYITSPREVVNRRLRIAAAVASVLVVAGGGLLYVNENMMPLDVAYAAFVNRINP